MPRIAEDLSGQKFGRLTVIERARDYPVEGVHFRCICDCGKEIIVRRDHLKKGHTKSCGCYSKDNLIRYNKEEASYNLIGQKFGKLTVIEKTDKRDAGNIVWKCECDCGNIHYVRTSSLINGSVQSCGCKHSERNSKGELKISEILENNKINFIREKTFEDCQDRASLPFDFYINNQYLIEFDGIQHFLSVDHFGGEDKFKIQQEHDEIKNEYCKEHNIPLIRIPYTHLDYLCLEDLLLETSQFIVT